MSMHVVVRSDERKKRKQISMDVMTVGTSKTSRTDAMASPPMLLGSASHARRSAHATSATGWPASAR